MPTWDGQSFKFYITSRHIRNKGIFIFINDHKHHNFKHIHLYLHIKDHALWEEWNWNIRVLRIQSFDSKSERYWCLLFKHDTNMLHINSLASLSSFTDFQKGNNKSGLEIFSSLLPHAPDWLSQKVNLKNTSNWISCALWLWGYNIQILKLNSNLYQNIPDCMRSNLQNKWMWTNEKHTLYITLSDLSP